MALQELIDGIRQLKADDLRRLLADRAAEDKAIKTLLRSTAARERSLRSTAHLRQERQTA